MQAKESFCAAAGAYFRKSSRKRGESDKSVPRQHEITQNFTVFAAALLDSASVLSEFAEIWRDSMKSRRNPVRMRAFPPEITKIRQILQNFAKGLTIYIYIYHGLYGKLCNTTTFRTFFIFRRKQQCALF